MHVHTVSRQVYGEEDDDAVSGSSSAGQGTVGVVEGSVHGRRSQTLYTSGQ